jgi:flagellar FliL protein
VAKGDKESKGGGGVIGLIVVTVVALGFGAGFGFFLDGQLKSAAETKTASKAKDTQAPEPPKPGLPTSGKIVAMSPIVVNLAEPHDTWMRIEASILVEGMLQGSDALAAQVSEDFVAYLRTAALSQFEGPSGFQNLREDLMDRATIRDREHIKDIIIHGIVVE